MRKRLHSIVSILLDAIFLNLAAIFTFFIFSRGFLAWQDIRYHIFLSLLFTPASLIIFYIFQLYDKKACRSRCKIVLNTCCSLSAVLMSYVVISYFFHAQSGPFLIIAFGLLFVLAVTLIAGWRLFAWYFQVKRNGYDVVRRLIVLESNHNDIQLFGDLRNTAEEDTRIVRFNDPASRASDSRGNGTFEEMNNIDSLVSFIETNAIREVFMESETMSRSSLVQFAQSLAGKEIRLRIVPDQYEVLVGAKIFTQGMSLPTIQLAENSRSGIYTNFRRVADVVISIVGLVLLAPLYPMIAIAIRATSPGPVFYKQKRVGLHGEIFTMWKFRTMYTNAEKSTGPVWAKANDDRVTPVGKFLRKTRLDEVAQFFNVLKGEMSFIGPRPERPGIVRELKDQIPYYIRRLQVKPGITGWAQVNLSYDSTLRDVRKKLYHDLYYIEKNSVLLDFIILLKTVHTVITGKGAH